MQPSVRSRLLRAVTAVAAAIVLAQVVAQPVAQTQTYTGVGGRHEQSRYFIQRNVPNPSSSVDVTIPSDIDNRRIFVRFLTDSTTSPVTGFDIHMKFNFLGEVVPAWIYTANAQNEPDNVVLTGQIGIGLGMHYCRASFPTAFAMQPNTLYFMAFRLPAGERLTFNTASSGTQVTYFVGASGAPQQARLQYGVHRGGFSPAITLGQPRIGQTFHVDLDGASIGLPAALWFQLPVPGRALDLYPFGAPGSALNLDLHNILFANLAPGQPGRSRRLSFPVANDPTLVGQALFYQWQVATSDTGIPAGWVTSNRGACVIL